MAELSVKSEVIESVLTGIAGFDRRKAIREDRCVPTPIGCGGFVEDGDFDTDLGRREYRISGLCADCQCSFFGSA